MANFKLKSQPAVMGFTPERLAGFRGPLVMWGFGIGVTVSLFLSSVPIFKRDVLQKVPVLGDYYTDKTPDSDKPF
ncbi:cytochrome b-c1 complex subunit 10 [Kockovaella imperatae]|uniref:Cytochrome b-c1 complex subunit 10 n=1 Tax=Kockovaella imperatae TaxID=4999 RepID=A0A1Y1UBE6_9TREE|nr:cytochrome b-c1 complex subunit 10 [Kockovaella imperatae]ORX35363.1 cytochrome b-c1 complex subunit 10 [Kockovaella imperatae]